MYYHSNGWEVNPATVDKIIRAKAMMFGEEEWNRCPCDGGNPERYCGSQLCQTDVRASGKCHCNLFLAKPEENGDD